MALLPAAKIKTAALPHIGLPQGPQHARQAPNVHLKRVLPQAEMNLVKARSRMVWKTTTFRFEAWSAEI